MMRDEKDPGTVEMDLSRRRGRPPKHASGAMTPAERARAYRRRRQVSFDSVSDMRDVSLIDMIKWGLQRVRAGVPDAQDTVDLYLEEFVKRHHSSHVDLYDQRKG